MSALTGAIEEPQSTRRREHAESALFVVIASVVLLIAAASKLIDPRIVATRLQAMHALIVVEVILGIWLLAGIHARWAYRTAIACFGLFAIASLIFWLRGRQSCGCFGSLTIHPMVTFLLDVAIVGGLLAYPPDNKSVGGSSRRGWLIVPTVCVLAVVVLIGRQRATTIDSEGMIAADARLIIIDPTHWIGRPLPLRTYIDVGERLARDQWTILMYHHDCPECLLALPKFEQLAREGRRVALIEVPPYAKSLIDPVRRDTACLRGKLSAERDWFVETPVVIELSQGRVTTVSNRLR